jgi:hypothetical protein
VLAGKPAGLLVTVIRGFLRAFYAVQMQTVIDVVMSS